MCIGVLKLRRSVVNSSIDLILFSNNSIDEILGKSIADVQRELTLEQKRIVFEKEKEKKKLDLETLRITKLKEKEQEKARKRDEREKVINIVFIYYNKNKSGEDRE